MLITIPLLPMLHLSWNVVRKLERSLIGAINNILLNPGRQIIRNQFTDRKSDSIGLQWKT